MCKESRIPLSLIKMDYRVEGGYMKVRDWEREKGIFNAGIRFYPYQGGFGIAFSWWPCIKRPQISLHIGPFKLWIGINGQKLIEKWKGR